jgi:acyl-CoA thioesterase I
VGIGYVRLARASTAKISTLLLAALLIVSAGIQGHAATVNIVVFGASNVAGRGVDSSAAFPAQLEGMLRAKGYDVRVVNAGVNRDTSAGMLSRLNSAVPDGTQIAIVQTPARNDLLRGAQGTTENMGTITSQLRARGIKVILIEGLILSVLSTHRQADGIHLTEQGHAVVAARLLPQVISAIGKPRR